MNLSNELKALRDLQIELAESTQEIRSTEFQTAGELLEKQAEETGKLIEELERMRTTETEKLLLEEIEQLKARQTSQTSQTMQTGQIEQIAQSNTLLEEPEEMKGGRDDDGQ